VFWYSAVDPTVIGVTVADTLLPAHPLLDRPYVTTGTGDARFVAKLIVTDVVVASVR
jgi:hypothetical protein